MNEAKIFAMPFSSVYPLYVEKVQKKGRTQQEVDEIICWLTGYDAEGLREQLEKNTGMEDFFAGAPQLHPNVNAITGVICKIRVEDMEEGTMKNIRRLDKLVDELAKGKSMEKILRSAPAK
ncbi:MAG: DUF2200 domain-containing protein [Lachnospiraceae bacterium]